MNKFSTGILIGALFFVAACDSNSSLKSDPKNRLEQYISRSFSVKVREDRKELTEFLTGSAKDSMVRWSDEQFLQAFVDNRPQFIKLMVREIKPVSAEAVNITYELTYSNHDKSSDAKVTNKKLCEMVREQGKWLIKDVHNIKEVVEYKSELSITTPSPFGH